VEHDEEKRMTITPRRIEFSHESANTRSSSESFVRNPIIRIVRYRRNPFFLNLGFIAGFIGVCWQRLLFHALSVDNAKRGKPVRSHIRSLTLLILAFSFLSMSMPAMAQKPVVPVVPVAKDERKTSPITTEKIDSDKSDKGDKNEKPGKNEDSLQRSKGLGIQAPADSGLRALRPTASSMPLADIIQQAGAAHNKPQLSRSDMVGEGRVTVYTKSGPVTFGVTLLVNGEKGSQRILLQQPDGKMWDGRGDHLAPGGLQALEFLETQHTRGLDQLLDSPKRDAALTDIGIKDRSQIITVREKSGDSAQYFLDTATSRLARFDFVRGQSRDSLGHVSPAIHSYAFTDFRLPEGVATAFLIEHDVNGVKQEELQLNKVRYSTAAIGVPAAPTGR
jgi:hypothetical protein